MKPNPLPRIIRPIKLILHICVCTALFSSCGSGGDNLTASGGIGGTGVTIGEVTSYGSIFVNGVEFDTRQADLYDEGNYLGSGDQAVLAHLPIGQQVVVQGDFTEASNGNAVQIDLFYRVLGPIQTIAEVDDNSFELIVLGQTVYVNQQTRLSGFALTSLTPGMVLKISGPVDADGAIHAGYIVRVADAMSTGTTVGVKGLPYLLDTRNQQFHINDLTVDYSQVSDPPDLLEQDLSIAVEGQLTGDVLIAQTLRRFDTEAFDTADDFSVDGFITAPLSGNVYRMGHYRVRINAATRFDGVTPEELESGIRVQVTGGLADRVVSARKVMAASRVRLESNVATVDLDNRIVTLDGIENTDIHVNFLTRIFGNALFLAGLAPGDHVRILAYSRIDGAVTATDIFVSPTDMQERFVLQGAVTGLSGARFDLLNQTIDTSAHPSAAYHDRDGTALTPMDFMQRLNIGALVRITGSWEQTQLIYEEINLIR